MSLIIILAADSRGTVALWRDSETGETGGPISLTDLAARYANAPKLKIGLALPGEGALTRRLRLPMSKPKDLARAAGLMLDDLQAAPMEDRALAFGVGEGDQRWVSALAGGLISEALALAQEAGIDPDIVTVDHNLLPLTDGDEMKMFDHGDRQSWRTDLVAFTAEPSFGDAVLRGDEHGSVLHVDADDLTMEGVPNFRTGPFVKRRPLPNLKPFALAASLTLVAGALFLAASLTEGLRYASAADRLTTRAEDAFAQAFPQQPIVDLERQLGRSIAPIGTVSDFLPLTAILAEVIDAQETMSLASLSYDAEGELRAELLFSSIPDLENVIEALAQRGVDVAEGSDTRREDGLLVTQLFLRVA